MNNKKVAIIVSVVVLFILVVVTLVAFAVKYNKTENNSQPNSVSGTILPIDTKSPSDTASPLNTNEFTSPDASLAPEIIETVTMPP
jgi:flagellar basal body-associated protein FliL